MPRTKRRRPQDLDDEFYRTCQSEFNRDKNNRVMQNVVNTVGITYSIINRECLCRHNYIFDITLRASHALAANQHQTGRCWMFAGLNMLRQQFMNVLGLESNMYFSANYLFFWDKMERINYLLESVILHQVAARTKLMDHLVSNLNTDGGWWNYFANLVSKYGLVPQQYMPRTYLSEDSSNMNQLLKYQVLSGLNHILTNKGQTLDQQRKYKQSVLSQVYATLVKCLGQPPEKFHWALKMGKNQVVEIPDVTPAQAYNLVMNVNALQPDIQEKAEQLLEAEVTPDNMEDLVNNLAKYLDKIDIDLDELRHKEPVNNFDQYIVLSHIPSAPYNKTYKVKWTSNMCNGQWSRFINVDIDCLKKYARQSIQGGVPVWFAADISQDYSPLYAVMDDNLYHRDQTFGLPQAFDKDKRMMLGELSANHAMLLTGFSLQSEEGDEPPIKNWQVENSWGYYHPHQPGLDGYLSMSDSWFEKYVIQIVVHKKFVSRYHRNKWAHSRQDTTLEPWNYITKIMQVDSYPQPSNYLQGHQK